MVLAGGRSTRMGRPKAALPWHGSTFLYRTAALLGRAVDGPVVVVAAPGQDLPALPVGVTVVEDPVEGLGPMQGVAAGLAAVADRAEVAFVCSTDMPFLHPAFVRHVIRALTGSTADIALPVARGFRQPLAAAYRTSLVGLITRLIGEGDLRPGMLFNHCEVTQLDDTRLLADDALARLDPDLESVANINTPEDYAAAVEQPAPEITINGIGTARAATLGEAADIVGMALTATVNGDEVSHDPLFPLVTGDSVEFRPTDAPRSHPT
ncbi:hypothetical protein GCM10029964_066620 [Kibdelosporangium lantanae]